MTALPPDPDPVDAPTAGDWSVEPGETPPDSSSVSASANKNPPPRRTLSPITVTAMVAVGLLFAVFLTVSVLYLLQVLGLMDRW